jgi:uncharacterized protein YcfL
MKKITFVIVVAVTAFNSCRSGQKFSGKEDSLLMNNLIKEVQDSVKITMSQAADTIDTTSIPVDSTLRKY